MPHVCVIGAAELCSAQPEYCLLHPCLLHQVIHPEPLVSKFSLILYVLKYEKCFYGDKKRSLNLCRSTFAPFPQPDTEKTGLSWRKENFLAAPRRKNNSSAWKAAARTAKGSILTLRGLLPA